MYKAHAQGYIFGQSGRRYKINPGFVLDVPNGELYGCPSVRWIGDEPEVLPEWAKPEKASETIYPKPLKGTVKQIKKWLDREGIDYPSGARKAELLTILENS
jgi:hypothetical protein